MERYYALRVTFRLLEAAGISRVFAGKRKPLRQRQACLPKPCLRPASVPDADSICEASIPIKKATLRVTFRIGGGAASLAFGLEMVVNKEMYSILLFELPLK